MTRTPDQPIRVLCVDDNPDIVEVLRMIIRCDPSMECVGSLLSASELVKDVMRRNPRPDLVILDATMPGKDPMKAMRELALSCPSTRTLIYSGHNSPDFIDRAIDFGAWGCVSKDAEPSILLRAMRDVASGLVVFPAREHDA